MCVKRKKPFLCKNINHFKAMRKSVLTTIWCLIAACSLGATDFVWKTGSPLLTSASTWTDSTLSPSTAADNTVLKLIRTLLSLSFLFQNTT